MLEPHTLLADLLIEYRNLFVCSVCIAAVKFKCLNVSHEVALNRNLLGWGNLLYWQINIDATSHVDNVISHQTGELYGCCIVISTKTCRAEEKPIKTCRVEENSINTSGRSEVAESIEVVTNDNKSID